MLDPATHQPDGVVGAEQFDQVIGHMVCAGGELAQCRVEGFAQCRSSLLALAHPNVIDIERDQRIEIARIDAQCIAERQLPDRFDRLDPPEPCGDVVGHPVPIARAYCGGHDGVSPKARAACSAQ
ncbi:hypothetical protein LRS12_09920 [Sphingomonas sp. J344]|nr:hypothetical protein [Sphingomonas sp. J344]MCR5871006.1 hypothetical protein [Sphingomonas sp. J344]